MKNTVAVRPEDYNPPRLPLTTEVAALVPAVPRDATVEASGSVCDAGGKQVDAQ